MASCDAPHAPGIYLNFARMADGAPHEMARSPSNAEIDTSAPFQNVKAARSMFENPGEKGKIPMPSAARSGSNKSGDWLTKQQGFVSPRSRGNSFEKPRAATVGSPDTATSEFRSYLSPSASLKGEKLEADLKVAQVQLEDAQKRAAALLESGVEGEAKRVVLEKALAEAQEALQQLEQKLAQEQASHKQAVESAEAELKKLQTALAKSEADHRDKINQVEAALTAMQTTNDAHSATQDQLAATNADLAAARTELATAKARAEEALTQTKKHEEASRASEAALAVAEKKAADALASAHVARQAEEQVKKEVAAALSEVELAKKANATLESRLDAASKELELAKHAEELARRRAAEEQAAREKEKVESTTAPVLETKSSMSAAYEDELSRFQGRLAEAEELADKRVAAVTAQLDAAKRADEETKAKVEALSAEIAAAKSAESSTKQKLEAVLVEAEQAKKALQAESDKAHDAGVTGAIAHAKGEEALQKLAAVQKERDGLKAELIELKRRSVAAPTTSSAQNGGQPAQKGSQSSGDRSGQVTVASEISEEVAHSSKPSAKPDLQQEAPDKKSQPACCIVM
ncbi:hypothetical protein KFL_002550060 [Klebsormidium nitens]|uniref:Uncharacterized protein n=1 Tax=Klebsormidium nitens TaxID=105231 RepID=A0A1Y1I8R5_KLENI|nr:hypothetical protein KFL_002550060 [Klebsormidium nitens]|eukprot:GAQ85799.1 hypothetical protein KFL_002550060 [Klebsormidium nitens]